ncbi:helix-turn-helix domain-containing protein [Novosphingobium sp. BL-8H]|uniref:helix-turn-helix domain-containing protein n=1 Tax=Novosphingobium sp. BL-8H TaxID=3127640 RepID=UPI0037566EE4
MLNGQWEMLDESNPVVPRYAVYGDTRATSDWQINAEPLDKRCRERGWTIAAHTHPRMTQLVYCTTGHGEITLDGEAIDFSSNCVMIVPPHRIHGFRYHSSASGWVVTIESHFLEALLGRAPQLRPVLENAGVFRLPEALRQELSSTLMQLVQETAISTPDGLLGAEIRLLGILLLMLRHWPMNDFSPTHRSSRSILVDRYYDVIEDRYRSQPTVTQLAAELRVSETQLRQSCVSVTGMSPSKILHDRVLAESKRCLAYSTLSVGQVSDALGFSDISYFSRFFKKHTSLSPTMYRSSRRLFSETAFTRGGRGMT